MSTIRVAVRVRPLAEKEKDEGSQEIVTVKGNSVVIENVKVLGIPEFGDSRSRFKEFTFDHCYNSMQSGSPYSTQAQVFEDLGSAVLKSAYDGFNACVLAYGQTGTGKTHTMMGYQNDPGLIPRICEGLFTHVETDTASHVSYRVDVSYFEIYNEKVRDLLQPFPFQQNLKSLKVRNHPQDGPYVEGLSWHRVKDNEEIQALVDKGNNYRVTAETYIHERSSRSHAIVTVCFTQARLEENRPSEKVSKINLVDLAGSERADPSSKPDFRKRLTEGANINRSLVSLGYIIKALAERSLLTWDTDEVGSTQSFNTSGGGESIASNSPSGPNKQKLPFIPYRDSNLTWLLKDSLGGNSKTIMIATITPASQYYSETVSTLRYAQRAKNIINKPRVNEDNNVALIRELRREIGRLQEMLADTKKGGNLLSLPDSEDSFIAEKLHENQEMAKQLTESWMCKWSSTHDIMKESDLSIRGLRNRTSSMGVMIDSQLPYLIGMDDDVLSTGVVIFHLKEGETYVGRDDAEKSQDIVLMGPNILTEHCIIRNINGEVILCPNEGSMCAVQGQECVEPIKLSQGDYVALGGDQVFRFNNPTEAAKLREHRRSQGSLNTLNTSHLSFGGLSRASSYSSIGGDDPHCLSPYSPLGRSYPNLELEQRHQSEKERIDLASKELNLLRQEHERAEELRQEKEEEMYQQHEQHKQDLEEQKQHLARLIAENERAKEKAEEELSHARESLAKEKEAFQEELNAEKKRLKELQTLEKDQKLQSSGFQTDSPSTTTTTTSTGSEDDSHPNNDGNPTKSKFPRRMSVEDQLKELEENEFSRRMSYRETEQSLSIQEEDIEDQYLQTQDQIQAKIIKIKAIEEEYKELDKTHLQEIKSEAEKLKDLHKKEAQLEVYIQEKEELNNVGTGAPTHLRSASSELYLAGQTLEVAENYEQKTASLQNIQSGCKEESDRLPYSPRTLRRSASAESLDSEISEMGEKSNMGDKTNDKAKKDFKISNTARSVTSRLYKPAEPKFKYVPKEKEKEVKPAARTRVTRDRDIDQHARCSPSRTVRDNNKGQSPSPQRQAHKHPSPSPTRDIGKKNSKTGKKGTNQKQEREKKTKTGSKLGQDTGKISNIPGRSSSPGGSSPDRGSNLSPVSARLAASGKLRQMASASNLASVPESMSEGTEDTGDQLEPKTVIKRRNRRGRANWDDDEFRTQSAPDSQAMADALDKYTETMNANQTLGLKAVDSVVPSFNTSVSVDDSQLINSPRLNYSAEELTCVTGTESGIDMISDDKSDISDSIDTVIDNDFVVKDNLKNREDNTKMIESGFQRCPSVESSIEMYSSRESVQDGDKVVLGKREYIPDSVNLTKTKDIDVVPSKKLKSQDERHLNLKDNLANTDRNLSCSDDSLDLSDDSLEQECDPLKNKRLTQSLPCHLFEDDQVNSEDIFNDSLEDPDNEERKPHNEVEPQYNKDAPISGDQMQCTKNNITDDSKPDLQNQETNSSNKYNSEKVSNYDVKQETDNSNISNVKHKVINLAFSGVVCHDNIDSLGNERKRVDQMSETEFPHADQCTNMVELSCEPNVISEIDVPFVDQCTNIAAFSSESIEVSETNIPFTDQGTIIVALSNKPIMISETNVQVVNQETITATLSKELIEISVTNAQFTEEGANTATLSKEPIELSESNVPITDEGTKTATLTGESISETNVPFADQGTNTATLTSQPVEMSVTNVPIRDEGTDTATLSKEPINISVANVPFTNEDTNTATLSKEPINMSVSNVPLTDDGTNTATLTGESISETKDPFADQDTNTTTLTSPPFDISVTDVQFTDKGANTAASPMEPIKMSVSNVSFTNEGTNTATLSEEPIEVSVSNLPVTNEGTNTATWSKEPIEMTVSNVPFTNEGTNAATLSKEPINMSVSNVPFVVESTNTATLSKEPIEMSLSNVPLKDEDTNNAGLTGESVSETNVPFGDQGTNTATLTSKPIEMSVTNVPFTDEGVNTATLSKEPIEMTFSNVPITDKGANTATLSEEPIEMFVSTVPITDEDTNTTTLSKEPMEMFVSNVPFTDKGANTAASSKELISLSASNVPIRDEGINNATLSKEPIEADVGTHTATLLSEPTEISVTNVPIRDEGTNDATLSKEPIEADVGKNTATLKSEPTEMSVTNDPIRDEGTNNATLSIDSVELQISSVSCNDGNENNCVTDDKVQTNEDKSLSCGNCSATEPMDNNHFEECIVESQEQAEISDSETDIKYSNNYVADKGKVNNIPDTSNNKMPVHTVNELSELNTTEMDIDINITNIDVNHSERQTEVYKDMTEGVDQTDPQVILCADMDKNNLLSNGYGLNENSVNLGKSVKLPMENLFTEQQALDTKETIETVKESLLNTSNDNASETPAGVDAGSDVEENNVESIHGTSRSATSLTDTNGVQPSSVTDVGIEIDNVTEIPDVKKYVEDVITGAQENCVDKSDNLDIGSEQKVIKKYVEGLLVDAQNRCFNSMDNTVSPQREDDIKQKEAESNSLKEISTKDMDDNKQQSNISEHDDNPYQNEQHATADKTDNMGSVQIGFSQISPENQINTGIPNMSVDSSSNSNIPNRLDWKLESDSKTKPDVQGLIVLQDQINKQDTHGDMSCGTLVDDTSPGYQVNFSRDNCENDDVLATDDKSDVTIWDNTDIIDNTVATDKKETEVDKSKPSNNNVGNFTSHNPFGIEFDGGAATLSPQSKPVMYIDPNNNLVPDMSQENEHTTETELEQIANEVIDDGTRTIGICTSPELLDSLEDVADSNDSFNDADEELQVLKEALDQLPAKPAPPGPQLSTARRAARQRAMIRQNFRAGDSDGVGQLSDESPRSGTPNRSSSRPDSGSRRRKRLTTNRNSRLNQDQTSDDYDSSENDSIYSDESVENSKPAEGHNGCIPNNNHLPHNFDDVDTNSFQREGEEMLPRHLRRRHERNSPRLAQQNLESAVIENVDGSSRSVGVQTFDRRARGFSSSSVRTDVSDIESNFVSGEFGGMVMSPVSLWNSDRQDRERNSSSSSGIIRTLSDLEKSMSQTQRSGSRSSASFVSQGSNLDRGPTEVWSSSTSDLRPVPNFHEELSYVMEAEIISPGASSLDYAEEAQSRPYFVMHPSQDGEQSLDRPDCSTPRSGRNVNISFPESQIQQVSNIDTNTPVTFEVTIHEDNTNISYNVEKTEYRTYALRNQGTNREPGIIPESIHVNIRENVSSISQEKFESHKTESVHLQNENKSNDDNDSIVIEKSFRSSYTSEHEMEVEKGGSKTRQLASRSEQTEESNNYILPAHVRDKNLGKKKSPQLQSSGVLGATSYDNSNEQGNDEDIPKTVEDQLDDSECTSDYGTITSIDGRKGCISFTSDSEDDSLLCGTARTTSPLLSLVPGTFLSNLGSSYASAKEETLETPQHNVSSLPPQGQSLCTTEDIKSPTIAIAATTEMTLTSEPRTHLYELRHGTVDDNDYYEQAEEIFDDLRPLNTSSSSEESSKGKSVGEKDDDKYNGKDEDDEKKDEDEMETDASSVSTVRPNGMVISQETLIEPEVNVFGSAEELLINIPSLSYSSHQEHLPVDEETEYAQVNVAPNTPANCSPRKRDNTSSCSSTEDSFLSLEQVETSSCSSEYRTPQQSPRDFHDTEEISAQVEEVVIPDTVSQNKALATTPFLTSGPVNTSSPKRPANVRTVSVNTDSASTPTTPVTPTVAKIPQIFGSGNDPGQIEAVRKEIESKIAKIQHKHRSLSDSAISSDFTDGDSSSLSPRSNKHYDFDKPLSSEKRCKTQMEKAPAKQSPIRLNLAIDFDGPVVRKFPFNDSGNVYDQEQDDNVLSEDAKPVLTQDDSDTKHKTSDSIIQECQEVLPVKEIEKFPENVIDAALAIKPFPIKRSLSLDSISTLVNTGTSRSRAVRESKSPENKELVEEDKMNIAHKTDDSFESMAQRSLSPGEIIDDPSHSYDVDKENIPPQMPRTMHTKSTSFSHIQQDMNTEYRRSLSEGNIDDFDESLDSSANSNDSITFVFVGQEFNNGAEAFDNEEQGNNVDGYDPCGSGQDSDSDSQSIDSKLGEQVMDNTDIVNISGRGHSSPGSSVNMESLRSRSASGESGNMAGIGNMADEDSSHSASEEIEEIIVRGNQIAEFLEPRDISAQNSGESPVSNTDSTQIYRTYFPDGDTSPLRHKFGIDEKVLPISERSVSADNIPKQLAGYKAIQRSRSTGMLDVGIEPEQDSESGIFPPAPISYEEDRTEPSFSLRTMSDGGLDQISQRTVSEIGASLSNRSSSGLETSSSDSLSSARVRSVCSVASSDEESYEEIVINYSNSKDRNKRKRIKQGPCSSSSDGEIDIETLEDRQAHIKHVLDTVEKFILPRPQLVDRGVSTETENEPISVSIGMQTSFDVIHENTLDCNSSEIRQEYVLPALAAPFRSQSVDSFGLGTNAEKLQLSEGAMSWVQMSELMVETTHLLRSINDRLPDMDRNTSISSSNDSQAILKQWEEISIQTGTSLTNLQTVGLQTEDFEESVIALKDGVEPQHAKVVETINESTQVDVQFRIKPLGTSATIMDDILPEEPERIYCEISIQTDPITSYDAVTEFIEVDKQEIIVSANSSSLYQPKMSSANSTSAIGSPVTVPQLMPQSYKSDQSKTLQKEESFECTKDTGRSETDINSKSKKETLTNSDGKFISQIKSDLGLNYKADEEISIETPFEQRSPRENTVLPGFTLPNTKEIEDLRKEHAKLMDNLRKASEKRQSRKAALKSRKQVESGPIDDDASDMYAESNHENPDVQETREALEIIVVSEVDPGMFLSEDGRVADLPVCAETEIVNSNMAETKYVTFYENVEITQAGPGKYFNSNGTDAVLPVSRNEEHPNLESTDRPSNGHARLNEGANTGVTIKAGPDEYFNTDKIDAILPVTKPEEQTHETNKEDIQNNTENEETDEEKYNVHVEITETGPGVFIQETRDGPQSMWIVGPGSYVPNEDSPNEIAQAGPSEFTPGNETLNEKNSRKTSDSNDLMEINIQVDPNMGLKVENKQQSSKSKQKDNKDAPKNGNNEHGKRHEHIWKLNGNEVTAISEERPISDSSISRMHSESDASLCSIDTNASSEVTRVMEGKGNYPSALNGRAGAFNPVFVDEDYVDDVMTPRNTDHHDNSGENKLNFTQTEDIIIPTVHSRAETIPILHHIMRTPPKDKRDSDIEILSRRKAPNDNRIICETSPKFPTRKLQGRPPSPSVSPDIFGTTVRPDYKMHQMEDDVDGKSDTSMETVNESFTEIIDYKPEYVPIFRDISPREEDNIASISNNVVEDSKHPSKDEIKSGYPKTSNEAQTETRLSDKAPKFGISDDATQVSMEFSDDFTQTEDNTIVSDIKPDNVTQINSLPQTASHHLPTSADMPRQTEGHQPRSGASERLKEDLEKLQKERLHILDLLGLSYLPTSLTVELLEAKLNYCIGQTDLLLENVEDEFTSSDTTVTYTREQLRTVDYISKYRADLKKSKHDIQECREKLSHRKGTGLGRGRNSVRKRDVFNQQRQAFIDAFKLERMREQHDYASSRHCTPIRGNTPLKGNTPLRGNTPLMGNSPVVTPRSERSRSSSPTYIPGYMTPSEHRDHLVDLRKQLIRDIAEEEYTHRSDSPVDMWNTSQQRFRSPQETHLSYLPNSSLNHRYRNSADPHQGYSPKVAVFPEHSYPQYNTYIVNPGTNDETAVPRSVSLDGIRQHSYHTSISPPRHGRHLSPPSAHHTRMVAESMYSQEESAQIVREIEELKKRSPGISAPLEEMLRRSSFSSSGSHSMYVGPMTLFSSIPIRRSNSSRAEIGISPRTQSDPRLSRPRHSSPDSTHRYDNPLSINLDSLRDDTNGPYSPYSAYAREHIIPNERSSGGILRGSYQLYDDRSDSSSNISFGSDTHSDSGHFHGLDEESLKRLRPVQSSDIKARIGRHKR